MLLTSRPPPGPPPSVSLLLDMAGNDDDDARSILTDAATLVGTEAVAASPSRARQTPLTNGAEHVRAWQEGVDARLTGVQRRGNAAVAGPSRLPYADANDDDAHSTTGRSSTSTLRPMPRQRSAPPMATDYAMEEAWGHALLAGGSGQLPRWPVAVPNEEDLTIPWWSAMLPSPSLSRTRSRGGAPARRRSSVAAAGDSAPEGSRSSATAPTQATTTTPTTPTTRGTASRRSTYMSTSPPPATDYGALSRPSALRSLPRSVSSPHSLAPPTTSRRHSRSPQMPAIDTAATSNPVFDEAPANAGFPEPPALPLPYRYYTKCFCEENAYVLAGHLQRICQRRNLETLLSDGEASPWRWEVDVVFVSNPDKTVALFEQRASEMPETDNVVIWDYHVFTVVTCSPTTEVLARQRASMAASRRSATTASSSGSRLTSSRSLRVSRGGRRRSTILSDGDDGAQLPSSQSLPNAVHDDLSAAREGNHPGLTGSCSWVYDLDTFLSVPTPLADYLQRTFKADSQESIAPSFRPQFRVISAKNYLSHFASDRSHMLVVRTHEERETEEAMRASVGWIVPEAPAEWAATPPSWLAICGPQSETSNKLMDAYVDMTARRVVSDDGRHGFIVTLAELMQGMGLGGDARVRLRAGEERAALGDGTAGLGEGEEALAIDPAVSRMIDRIELQLSSGATQTVDDAAASPSATTFGHHRRTSSGISSSTARRRASTGNSGRTEEDEAGMVVGVRRIYGVRPPPPVPESDDRFARLTFHGRGKRVSSPLFPAYMHATLQSRAAKPELARSSLSSSTSAAATARLGRA